MRTVPRAAQPVRSMPADVARETIRQLAARHIPPLPGSDALVYAVRGLLATFVERLGTMADATGQYHESIRACTGRIAAARDLGELSDVVGALEQDARAVETQLVRERNELGRMRAEAAEQEARVRRLEQELADTSALIKVDVLTQALNRRGLAEAFAVEVSRSERTGFPLAVALLDVDNFKQLNDRLGHLAGDGALAHLAATIRGALRPTDTVARYGGEEFAVLLPNTPLDEAAAALTRVQRDLARHRFLHDGQGLLITFSAGVTLRARGEDEATTVARADAALLRAKAEGKNRVVAAG